MAVAHLRDIFIRAWRRSGDRFDIKGDEHGFDADFLELVDDLGFLLPSPGSVPIFRQRLDVRPLGFDPGFGVGIAVQVDDSQSLPSSFNFAPMRSVKSFFETLPKGDSGNSFISSKRSGSLCLAISSLIKKLTSSDRVSAVARRRITQAHMRSPSAGSGIGTQATFCTEGWVRMRFSISSALIFSPPRLIRSFLRPSTM